MQILVVIRHPAAFCSSLKLKGWSFDFNSFLDQPNLMDCYLSEFANDINMYAKKPPGVVEQAALLWNIFHAVVLQYRSEHGDWLFCRHEDLSKDPVTEFRSVFEFLGLDFDESIELKILESTGAKNPQEQVAGKNLRRDSRKNIFNWKSRLSTDEIAYIRRKTEHLACCFYDNERDW